MSTTALDERILADRDLDRFWSKVEIGSTCWVWVGARHVRGYGQFNAGRERRWYVHRLAYELLVGPIPDGLTIDHLCRNKACVNPDHLEPVTAAENTRRAHAGHPTCQRGHAFDETNTYWVTGPNGRKTRECRSCKRLRAAVRRAR